MDDQIIFQKWDKIIHTFSDPSENKFLYDVILDLVANYDPVSEFIVITMFDDSNLMTVEMYKRSIDHE